MNLIGYGKLKSDRAQDILNGESCRFGNGLQFNRTSLYKFNEFYRRSQILFRIIICAILTFEV